MVGSKTSFRADSKWRRAGEKEEKNDGVVEIAIAATCCNFKHVVDPFVYVTEERGADPKASFHVQ